MAEWLAQRPAKPFTPVRFRLQPPIYFRSVSYSLDAEVFDESITDISASKIRI